MTVYMKEENIKDELDKVLYSIYTLRSVAHHILEKYGNTSEHKEINTSIAELKEFLGHNGCDDEKGAHFAEASQSYLKSDDYYVHLFKAQETAVNALKWAHFDRDKEIAKQSLRIVDLRMKVGYNNTGIKYKLGECGIHKNISESNKSDKFYKILRGDISPWTHDAIWALPKNNKPGDWMPLIKGPLLHEQNGYHLCNGIDGFRDWIEWQKFDLGQGHSVYEVEFDGENIVCGGEIIVRTCRLTKETKWSCETEQQIAKRCLRTNNSTKHNKILHEYLETGNIMELYNA